MIYRNQHMLARYGNRIYESQNVERFKKYKDLWKDKTIIVLASGPSLTETDVNTIKELDLPTIVTNNTFQLAPWANILIFHDANWWRKYRVEVSNKFKGQAVTVSLIRESNVLSLHGLGFNGFGNSGAAGISFAIYAGAKRVICLGLDCKLDSDGKTHWHGDHIRGLGNAVSLPKWFVRFDELAEYAKDQNVEIINASRDTALESFTRIQLEDLL